MRTPGRPLLALLFLAAALLGTQSAGQQAPAPLAPAFSAPAFSAQNRSGASLTLPPTPGLPQLPGLTQLGETRWNAATLPASDPVFELTAPAGTSVTLSQVGSTVFELSGLEVSGLGNAGNAALEQELRAGFRALDALGQSQSRTVQLQVLSRSPAGTELSTRWSSDPGALAEPTNTAQSPELQLRQLLLPGGVRGPLEVSSPDTLLAARYRLLDRSDLQSLSPEAAAPYGAVLSAGERVSGLGQQPVLPLFRAALGTAQPLQDWSLPDLSRAELPPLDVRRERVYQGQNSRGDHLFQTQSRAQPWQQTLQGPAAGTRQPDAGRSSLTLEVLDMAQMSQAVYRADGLPHSAFEFSTLQLQVTARSGAATVRFTVQVRSTSALRPLGG